MRYRTVKAMEKKRNKNPCEGCVWPAYAEGNKVLCPFQRCVRKEYERLWRVQTSEDKVLCMFPRCVRKEYERYWPQGKQSDEKAKDH